MLHSYHGISANGSDELPAVLITFEHFIGDVVYQMLAELLRRTRFKLHDVRPIALYFKSNPYTNVLTAHHDHALRHGKNAW